ncbi:MAG: tetratricopeptide repeat protein [Acidobacteria bacterium]|nr:tetratricopeptide repeat protein [Acidobacteriota bacterium]
MLQAKLFMLPLAALSLCAITFATASAQPGRESRTLPNMVSISGQVRLPQNTEAAEMILVTLESRRGGIVAQVRTDRTGKFKFSGIGTGQYKVVIRHPGYQEIQREIDLETVTSEYVQFQLVPEKSASAPTAPNSLLVNAAIPPEAQKEFDQGQTDLKDNKTLQNGIAHLEKAISLYPKFLEAHLLLGTAYITSKQLDKAEHELHKTLEIDPKVIAAYFALGDVYRQKQKYPDAEKVLLDGLKLEPKSPLGHFTLGQVYFAKGDITKAGPEVGQALQLKPDYAEAYLLAGNLFLKARNANSALQMYEQYLRLEPKGEYAQQAREMTEKIKKALAEKKQ